MLLKSSGTDKPRRTVIITIYFDNSANNTPYPVHETFPRDNVSSTGNCHKEWALGIYQPDQQTNQKLLKGGRFGAASRSPLVCLSQALAHFNERVMEGNGTRHGNGTPLDYNGWELLAHMRIFEVRLRLGGHKRDAETAR